MRLKWWGKRKCSHLVNEDIYYNYITQEVAALKSYIDEIREHWPHYMSVSLRQSYGYKETQELSIYFGESMSNTIRFKSIDDFFNQKDRIIAYLKLYKQGHQLGF